MQKSKQARLGQRGKEKHAQQGEWPEKRHKCEHLFGVFSNHCKDLQFPVKVEGHTPLETQGRNR